MIRPGANVDIFGAIHTAGRAVVVGESQLFHLGGDQRQ